MIAIPAVDLREGACVQLVGGRYDDEQVRLSNPVTVLQTWQHFGFGRAHVVDLDAATGRGSNADVVTTLLGNTTMHVQVGGGVRDDEAVRGLLAAGARYAVVGTRALEDPDWLVRNACAHTGSLIVAVDVHGRDVLCGGWTRSLKRNVTDVIRELNTLPLAGILVTAVHVEGRMQGPDLRLAEDVVAAARLPLLAAGGIGSVGDLRALAERGVAAAVIGMALYTGSLDARAVAQEFAA